MVQALRRRTAVGLLILAIAVANAWPLAAEELSPRSGLLGRWFGSRAKREMHGEAPVGQPSHTSPTGAAPAERQQELQPTNWVEPAQRIVAETQAGPPPEPGSPVQPPVTLESLEQLALANNPTLPQAQAVVDAARGRLLQAGLYPNPSIAYVGSEIGNDGRAGQQGMSVGQEVVLGRKLRLGQAVAGYEMEQAVARVEAQRYRVLNAVRVAYYSTLAAERTVKRHDVPASLRAEEQQLQEAARKQLAAEDRKQLQEQQRVLRDKKSQYLLGAAETAVEIADELLKAGQGNAPDLLQAEVDLEQERILAENAANTYRGTWKQLAVVVGAPDMQPSRLAGDLEEGIAELASEDAISRILAMSPEVRVAGAGVQRAQAALRRAQAQPIPNITLDGAVQYDYATRDTIVGVGLSLPLPIHNRNQGNIFAAQAELVRANRERDRVRLSLTSRFASAFVRYENARQQTQKYRERILPKAEKTLRLVREGWQRGEFPFLQVLTAQRTLAQSSLAYLAALAELRASIVEIEGLLLIDGLNGEATEPVGGFIE